MSTHPASDTWKFGLKRCHHWQTPRLCKKKHRFVWKSHYHYISKIWSGWIYQPEFNSNSITFFSSLRLPNYSMEIMFFAKFWQNHFTTDFMSFSAQQTKMTPTALLRKPSGNTQQTSSPWWCRSCRLKLHREKWKVAEVHQFGDHQLQGRKHCNSSISLLCTKSTGAGIHLERHLAYTHAFERITSISSYMMITFCTSWRPNDPQSFAAHNIIRICGWSIYQCHLAACCFNIGFPSILD